MAGDPVISMSVASLSSTESPPVVLRMIRAYSRVSINRLSFKELPAISLNEFAASRVRFRGHYELNGVRNARKLLLYEPGAERAVTVANDCDGAVFVNQGAVFRIGSVNIAVDFDLASGAQRRYCSSQSANKRRM